MKRGENLFKHGLTGTPEHRAWCGMMTRCYWCIPGDRNYALYRGAGITVDDKWHDFRAFLADVGQKPDAKHSLDRYPNPKGNYGPGNVRWATAQEQARNWSNRNRWVTFNDETLLLQDWAARLGIRRESLRDRIDAGWPLERALTKRPQARMRNARGHFV